MKRIEDVRDLRAAQFPEDAGPTAHPIRPDSYIAMDNFYTMTVPFLRTLLVDRRFRLIAYWMNLRSTRRARR